MADNNKEECMSSSSGGGTQLVTMLTTFAILMVPIIVLNVLIAKRKGKNVAEYGWLSVIPFVGYFLTIYLLSLTDKALQDKVDRIFEVVTGGSAQGVKVSGTDSLEASRATTDKWENRPPKGY